MLVSSIDIETTGLNPQEDQILEIAIIQAAVSDSGVKILDSFHKYVRHNRISGSPVALEMNAKILNREDGEYLENIVESLDTFLVAKTVPLGKNVAGFDLPFLKHVLGSTITRRFTHRCIDIGNLFLKWDAKYPPSMPECMEMCGLLFTNEHTAYGDALDNLRLLNFRITGKDDLC